MYSLGVNSKMSKRFVCVIALCAAGCSGANFDVAAFVDDTGCLDNCGDTAETSVDSDVVDSGIDSVTTDSQVAETQVEPDTTVADTAVPDTQVQPDTNKADTFVADTAVQDTYTVKDTAVKDTAVACTPKTCTSLYLETGNMACGSQPDGCGGTVSCGDSCSDVTKSCGGSPGFDGVWSPTTGSLGSPLPPVPYQCVGTCKDLGTITSWCNNSKGYTHVYHCSNPILKTLSSCVPSIYPAYTNDKSVWCCDQVVQ